jgi:hypothetical protein
MSVKDEQEYLFSPSFITTTTLGMAIGVATSRDDDKYGLKLLLLLAADLHGGCSGIQVRFGR